MNLRPSWAGKSDRAIEIALQRPPPGRRSPAATGVRPCRSSLTWSRSDATDWREARAARSLAAAGIIGGRFTPSMATAWQRRASPRVDAVSSPPRQRSTRLCSKEMDGLHGVCDVIRLMSARESEGPFRAWRLGSTITLTVRPLRAISRSRPSPTGRDWPEPTW